MRHLVRRRFGRSAVPGVDRHFGSRPRWCARRGQRWWRSEARAHPCVGTHRGNGQSGPAVNPTIGWECGAGRRRSRGPAVVDDQSPQPAPSRRRRGRRPAGAQGGLAFTHARIIHVGKSPGDHAVSQEDINAILVDEAAKGNRVVRLKGGDPFVLGRGGEELAACLAAGIDVEVVPGITSAVAVPAAAGIPVTHRGMATGFLVATAHGEDPHWSSTWRPFHRRSRSCC